MIDVYLLIPRRTLEPRAHSDAYYPFITWLPLWALNVDASWYAIESFYLPISRKGASTLSYRTFFW